MTDDLQVLLSHTSKLFTDGLDYTREEFSALSFDSIDFKIPFVQVTSIQNVLQDLMWEENEVVVIDHQFEGQLEGNSHIVFEAKGAMRFIRHFLSEPTEFEYFLETEKEALADISTSIINGVLKLLIKDLKVSIQTMLPRIHQGMFLNLMESLLFNDGSQEGDNVLMVPVVVQMLDSNVKCELVFIQEVNSYINLTRPILRSLLRRGGVDDV